MTHYEISWRFHVAVAPADEACSAEERRAVLEAHLDRVMQELLALESSDEWITGPSLGVEFSTGSVEVDVVVWAATLEQALSTGLAAIRTAVNAAGGHTGSWDAGHRPEEGLVEYGFTGVELETVAA